MNRRVKAVLIAMAVTAVSLVVAIAGWVAAHSRDIPAPDVSALRIQTIEVSDENNAFVYFEKAVDSFEWPEHASRVDSILMGKEWDDEFVAGLLSRNAQTLALVKRGLACPAYQPHVESRLEAPKLPYFWSHRVEKLLALETMRDERAGQVGSAWESCLGRCRLSSMFATRPRGVVESFASLAALTMALDHAAQRLAESTPQATDLVRLLETLNGIGSLDRGVIRAFKEEFQLLSEVIDDRESARARYWLLSRYMYQPNRTKQMCAEFLDAAVSAASHPYSEVHMPDFQPVPTQAVSRRLMVLKPNGAGRILAAVLTSPDALTRLVAIKCSVQSRLDGLRLVAACRLYEIRHGRLPETLEALAPECLSEVPRDPFDGKRFRYLPEGAIVYSIGKDLIDSTASGPRASDAPPPARAQPKSDDLVYAILPAGAGNATNAPGADEPVP
jgi:hypothetical protein